MEKEDGFVTELFCKKYGIYDICNKIEQELDKLAEKILEQQRSAKINNSNAFEKLKDKLKRFKFFSRWNSAFSNDESKLCHETRLVYIAMFNFLHTKKPEYGIELMDKANNAYSHISKVCYNIFNNLKSANEAIDYVKDIKCSIAYMDKLYKLMLEAHESMMHSRKLMNNLLNKDKIDAFVLDTYSKLRPNEFEDDKIC